MSEISSEVRIKIITGSKGGIVLWLEDYSLLHQKGQQIKPAPACYLHGHTYVIAIRVDINVAVYRPKYTR